MAIMAAGGLVPGAQLDRIRVTRANGARIDFDYKQYLDTGDAKLLPQLRPLDVVFVQPDVPLDGVHARFSAPEALRSSSVQRRWPDERPGRTLGEDRRRVGADGG